MQLRMLRPHLVLALMLAVAAFIAPTGCGGGDFPEGSPLNPIRIFFVTSAEADAVRNSGNAIAEYLTATTGYSFDAVVSTAYQTVIEAMGTADADLAFLPTNAYIKASERYGAEVALCTVRYGDKFYRAQFIARADKGFTKLEDFEDQVWGFSDFESTSGHVIPNMMLEAAGITVKQKITTGGHANTIQQVYEGNVDFGTTFWSPEGRDARSLQVTAFPDVFERVKIALLTIPIPNDTVTFRRGFDSQLREAISTALQAYVKTDEGHQALYDMYNIDDLAPVDASFYADFRKIVHGEAIIPDDEDADLNPIPTKGRRDDPYLVASTGVAYGETQDGTTLPAPWQLEPTIAVALSPSTKPAVEQVLTGEADVAVLRLAGAVAAVAGKARVLAVSEVDPVFAPGVTRFRIVARARNSELPLGIHSLKPETSVGLDAGLGASMKAAAKAFARQLGLTGPVQEFAGQERVTSQVVLSVESLLDDLAHSRRDEHPPDIDPPFPRLDQGLLVPELRVIAFSALFPNAVVVASPKLNPAAIAGLLKAVTATREDIDAYPHITRFVPADATVLGEWATWLAHSDQ